MKRFLGIALGIVTSIGGFLDAGSIATSSQAGAAFGYSLLWALTLGTVCVIFLVEMSGRFAIASEHTITDAIRKRFGFPALIVPFALTMLVNLLVLASEVGGVCVALELATGIGFQVWAIPVAIALWLLLWVATFDVVEEGTAVLGLVTLCFVVALWKLGAEPAELARALVVPSLPGDERAHYLFLAVSIVGATIAPYLFLFYSSGAIEDHWDKSYLTPNRLIAAGGMLFGAAISMAVLVVAALTLKPQGIQVESYEQAALMLLPAFGHWGFWLFVVSLAIACFGAALELSLASAYAMAQTFGWNWGENLKPRKAARFSMAYTVFIALAALIVLTGLNPMKLTLFSMAFTALILPLTAMPFLILMNDPTYMGAHVNSRFSNIAVVLIVIVAAVLAVVSIPLEIMGSR